PGRALVAEAVSVEAIAPGDAPKEQPARRQQPAPPVQTVRMFTGGKWCEAPLYRREALGAGQRIDGPAIIAEANATTVVEPQWRASVTELDHLVLERTQPRVSAAAIGTKVDPVRLEIFNNLFMSIAEQMGLRLQNTAYSVNIKERLDFSCAIFDGAGNLIADEGRFREKETIALLTAGRYPVRNVEQNVADLRAQIAANEKGVQELGRMVEEFGLDVVQAYMGHVQDNAEESVRRVIGVLKDGEYDLPMDNGAHLKVKIRIGADRRSAAIDFTGTSPQLPNNFNAPSAVCMAAVLYVFRTLVDADIPLNSGCLKPLNVVIPDGCMLKPRYPAAVVAGNVE